MYKFKNITMLYDNTDETTTIPFGQYIRGIMVKKSLRRPMNFIIEELDNPINGTKFDNEWFNSNLIPTFSGDPKHKIINKFLQREDQLKSLEK